MSTVQALWIGPRLSLLEQTCLRSFLTHQIHVQLYTYGPVEGIPPGVEVLDGNLIVPESEIFYYEGGRVSAFSNYFRYQLLYQKGGIWVDMDMVLLRPLDLPQPYAFTSEQAPGSREIKVNVGLLKAPKGSRLMQLCVKACDQMRRSRTSEGLAWGSYGPKLFRRFVTRLRLTSYILPPDWGCPYYYTELEDLITPERVSIEDLSSSTMIHLWNECWNRAQLSKDDSRTGSLYDQLVQKYKGLE